MHRFILLAGLTLMACNDDKGESQPLDTGDSTGGGGDDGGTDGGDDDTGEQTCTASVEETTPFDGEAGVYYRSEIQIIFSESADTQADISIVASDGGEIPTAVTWDENAINAYVAPDTLLGDSSYELLVDLCGDVTTVAFSTNEYGSPMDVEADALIGNTYFFDMSGADYVRPEGLGPLIGNYLTEPLLFGVTNADTSTISIVGAQGGVSDTTGNIYQVSGLATWDFGSADFTAAPFFKATAEQVGIDYADVTINIYNFEVEGTFAPDGSSIGGGIANGLADTRYLGEIIGFGTGWYEVCDFVASAGLDCETCPDGEETCLTLEAHFDDADLVDGLTIEEVAE